MKSAMILIMFLCLAGRRDGLLPNIERLIVLNSSRGSKTT